MITSSGAFGLVGNNPFVCCAEGTYTIPLSIGTMGQRGEERRAHLVQRRLFVGGDDARGRGRHHALSLEWLGFAMLVSRWSSTSIFTVFATPPARIKATEGLLSWTLALDSCPTKVPHENQTFSR